ncbi:MAG: hypothetical protein RL701_3036 [Pseudomonadota bacterium]
MTQSAVESPDSGREPSRRDSQQLLRSSLLVPNDTCWRIEQTEHLSVLIDAEAYFVALRSALVQARERVFILGWDVDSRTRLGSEDTVKDGLPLQLLPLLQVLLDRRPELQVYVLSWDFSMIYTLEREWMPSWVFTHAHPRLHFQLDSAHVVGASQHQKLVVVDDTLAFTGGIDLTIRRWDRTAHDVDDRARRDPEGELYPPMHDVQLCLDGAAASALAESARERWQRATAHHAGAAVPAAISGKRAPTTLWPEQLPYSFETLPVGLSRTFSTLIPEDPDIHEIARLTERVFQTAQRYIYIENQYFTSSIAAKALVACLEKPEGPEVILVLPVMESGWLEQSSMGILRKQVLARVRSSDRHGRLHMFYPQLPGSQHGLHIHCKLMIADDQLLKIGSANLSNRSLGLDTECDVSIETRPEDPDYERISDGVRSVLARLLAEHLELDERDCRERLDAAPSLVAFIEAERAHSKPRRLERLPEHPPDPALDLRSLGEWAVDPERPMAGETFVSGLFPIRVRIPWLRGAAASVALIVPVLLMTVYAMPHAVQLEQWTRSSTHLVWLWLAYTLAATLFAPLSLLLGAVCTLLDSGVAFAFALSGALLSASLSHGIGRIFRPWTLRWLHSQRVRQLQHSARIRAVRATIIARLLPVGNFTASNLLAGALAVPFGRFWLGNLAGLAYGSALVVGFAKCAQLAVRTPSALNVALCCVAGILLIALSYGAASVVGRTFSAAERAARNRPHQG